MSSLDLTNAYQVFEVTFGTPKTSDQPIIEFLAETHYREFSVGDTWSQDLHLPEHYLIVFQGKIRVLYQAVNGVHQPLSMFVGGDVINSHEFNIQGLQYLGSEEGFYCHIPKRLIENSETVMAKLQETSRRIEEAFEMLNNPSAKMSTSQAVESLRRLEDTLEPQESRNDRSSEFNLTAPDCLRLILDHYNPNLPNKLVMNDILHTSDHLFRKLDQMGLTFEQKQLSWNDCMDASFPYLLIEEDGAHETFHWIIGRRGNALIEQAVGESRAFLPAQKDSQKWRAAFIAKERQQQEAPKNRLPIPLTLGWYQHVLKRFWLLTTQMATASLLVQLFALANPIFLMVIFDRVFGRQNLSALEIMTVGVVLVALFELAIRFFRSHILAYQLELLDRVSIKALLDRFFSIPLTQGNGELIRSFTEKFNEIVRVNFNFLQVALVSSMDALFSAIILVYLMTLHWQLALVSTLTVVPLIIVSAMSAPRIRERQKLFMKNQRRCQVKLNELAQGQETVKSLSASKLLRSQLGVFAQEHLVEQADQYRLDRSTHGVWNSFFANLGYIVVLFFGAQEVLNGRISYGEYLAINMMSRRIMSNFQNLVMMVLELQSSLSSVEQIKQLFQTADEYQQQTTDGVFLSNVKGRMCFHDVSFRYSADSQWILKDVNFTLEPGEKVVLCGKSGAGKSTLIRLAQRLVSPELGYITLDGFNTADFDLDNLRSLVGVVLQRPTLFQATIRENIAVGRPEAPMSEIIQAASAAELDSFIVKLPDGFDHEVAPMGANLSGGQVARIALARVLLLNPKVLVLDEAINSVEPATRGAVFGKIFEQFKNQTCLFVTDYLPVHQKADRILVLDEGQIVESGTFDELMSLKGYYYHITHSGMSAVAATK